MPYLEKSQSSYRNNGSISSQKIQYGLGGWGEPTQTCVFQLFRLGKARIGLLGAA